MDLQRDLTAGAIAGLAGGAVLTAWWLVGRQSGTTPEPLPQRVAHWVEDRTGLPGSSRPSPLVEEGLAQGGHLVAATALGAAFGALRSSGLMSSTAAGPLFGLAIYGLNVAGLGNLLGITRRPDRENSSVVGQQLVEYMVFGLVTSLVARRVRASL
jgi:hypothetical protein